MADMDTAIILAGGKSSRMGFDKQFLMLKDSCMVEVIAAKLEKVFNEIIIVTNKPGEYAKYGYKLAEDEVSGYGPLAGIHVGLKSSSSLFSYIVACDMPLINIEYTKYMMELIRQNDGKADGVITRLGNWIEPFNAFYSKNLISRIEENIKKGKMQINLFVQESDMIYIDEEKAKEFSPGWEMFTNINTLRDYEMLIEKIKGGQLC